MPTSILIIGATGLVGSHLIVALKKTHPEFPLTVYIRNSSERMRDYLTKTVGVDRIVIGDFSESEKIAKLAAEHEIVINSGSSWDVPLTQAVVQGMKKRYGNGKGKGSLIHLSGTGNFVNGRKDGKYSSESKVWNDDNEEDIKLLHAGMLNGGPDVEVLAAGRTNKLNTYSIFPSGIYGASLGPEPSSALGTIQLLYKAQAEQLGFVPYIGEGIPEEALKTCEPAGSVYSRCSIASSQTSSWKEASPAFARLFHAQGIVTSPEAKSVKMEEAGEGELPHLKDGSLLLKNDRAKRLGYKPMKEGILEYLENEVKALKGI